MELMIFQFCYLVGVFCVEKDGREIFFYIGQVMDEIWFDFIFFSFDKKLEMGKDDNNKVEFELERLLMDDDELLNKVFLELEIVLMISDQIFEKVWGLLLKCEKLKFGFEVVGVWLELWDSIIEEVQKKE